MRSKKAIKNIIFSFFLQITSIISGLVLPRLIIGTYGSNVNGMVSSITQFLGYIALLEAGVGGVTRAALYKPLAKKSNIEISRIVRATEIFFKKLAYIFTIYSLILAAFYPFIINDEFNYLFTSSLVVIIGLSTFSEYYFGISYQILLHSDQRLYISQFLQIITIILNVIISWILIKSGFGIHIVKLSSSLIFVIRPILLNLYVRRKYNLMKDITPDNNAIKQRWDGLGHHIAYYLHRHTDVAVLTLFTNLKTVSIYSVYFMVVSAISRVITIFSQGMEAAFGNMIAKGEGQTLKRTLSMYNFISFTLTTALFTATAILIIPFVALYTSNVTDANYIMPLFGYVLILAEAVYLVRLPYHSVVLAAGHFKQTKNAGYIEALINIVLSVILVNFLGLVGVAIATFIAMIYRTIFYVIYLSKTFVAGSTKNFVYRVLISILSIVITIFIIKMLPLFTINSYKDWFIYAIIVTTISMINTFLLNALIFVKDVKNIILVLRHLMKI